MHRASASVKVADVLEVPLWLWGAFAVTVVVSLAVDLLAHRTAHVIGFKEAAAWSAGWVSLALMRAARREAPRPHAAVDRCGAVGAPVA